MKHIFTTTLLLLALILPATASAYDFEADGIYYNINGNEATVTYQAYYNNNYSGDIFIPTTVTYNGTIYSITSIENRAFSGCSGMISINIPNSVTSIGNMAFSGCTGLMSITVANDNPKYDSRNNCNAIIETASNTLIVGCKNTVIPNSITSIGNSAFRECASLTSICIPNSVTTIGGDAFTACTGLTNIDIPNSVTTIDEYAFWGCTGLTSIEFPNSVTTINEEAFENCRGLTSITIPSSVIHIGGGAFFECTNLNDVFCHITNLTQLSIGYSAFACESSYKERTLHVPYGTLEAYQEHSNLGRYFKTIVEMDFPIEVDNIYYIIINSNEVEVAKSPNNRYTGNITIPTSITYNGTTYSVTGIGYEAFRDCSELTSINIPNSVTSIGNNAFYCCSGLTNIDIPNSVTTIGDHAFAFCKGLLTIDIPNSVTYIRDFAFTDCYGLTSVTIPNSITYFGCESFMACASLIEVYSFITDLQRVPLGDLAFYSGSNYADRTLHVPYGTLAAYQADSRWSQYFGTIVEMDNSFEVDGIFYRIPGNDTTVMVIPNPSSDPFSGDIIIPANVTYDGTTYTVTSIAEQAFANCPGLTSITIPSSVTSVGKQAFMNDAAIESVTCEAMTPPAWEALDLFTANVYNHSPLFVPKGCARAYMSDQCWGQFAKIIGTGDINGDGNISVGDVTMLIGMVLGGGNSSPAADVNGDGSITVSDVTALISMVLGSH